MLNEMIGHDLSNTPGDEPHHVLQSGGRDSGPSLIVESGKTDDDDGDESSHEQAEESGHETYHDIGHDLHDHDLHLHDHDLHEDANTIDLRHDQEASSRLEGLSRTLFLFMVRHCQKLPRSAKDGLCSLLSDADVLHSKVATFETLCRKAGVQGVSFGSHTVCETCGNLMDGHTTLCGSKDCTHPCLRHLFCRSMRTILRIFLGSLLLHHRSCTIDSTRPDFWGSIYASFLQEKRGLSLSGEPLAAWAAGFDGVNPLTSMWEKGREVRPGPSLMAIPVTSLFLSFSLPLSLSLSGSSALTLSFCLPFFLPLLMIMIFYRGSRLSCRNIVLEFFNV